MKNLVGQLFSPRLMMRVLDINDAKPLQRMLADNKQYMLPWIPWAVNEPMSVEVKKEQIRTWKGEFYLDKKYSYGIFDKTGHRLVGLIFLFTRQGDGILEIGYIIDQQEAGNGYATESCYALTKLGFEHLEIDKMVIHCDPANKASARIAEKLGYRLEGTYGLPRTEEGQRRKNMIWAMFMEEFVQLESYEPVNFETEEGW